MDYRAPTPAAPLIIVAGNVTALDRTTGSELWRYPLKGVARRFALDGDRVFVFESHGTFHCLELATGRLLGKAETKLESADNMLVDGDRIYLTDDHHAVALDFNGTILWRVPIPSSGTTSLSGLGVPGGNIVQPDFSRAG